jgi:hypothetical protein
VKQAKPTYSVDQKAPRMRKAKYSKSVVTDELCRSFLKQFPEYKLSTKEFYRLWMDIAETIREEAIFNPLGVKLGSYTGELKLQYIPYKLKAEDPHSSSEVGEKINHINLLTRGKVAKIKWERRWAVKFNKMLQFFGFEPTRKMNIIAKKYTDQNPEKIRVSRNTLGGFSMWRQI